MNADGFMRSRFARTSLMVCAMSVACAVAQAQQVDEELDWTENDALLAPDAGWERSSMGIGWSSRRFGPARFHLDGSWNATTDLATVPDPWTTWGGGCGRAQPGSAIGGRAVD